MKKEMTARELLDIIQPKHEMTFKDKFDKAAAKYLWRDSKYPRCCVCKKKPIKWKMSSMNYGFCSKKCIAENSIKHYKMIKVN